MSALQQCESQFEFSLELQYNSLVCVGMDWLVPMKFCVLSDPHLLCVFFKVNKENSFQGVCVLNTDASNSSRNSPEGIYYKGCQVGLLFL